MILFCSPSCAYSHRIRIVLLEKGVAAAIESFDNARPPASLLEHNALASSPTLVDRDLVLTESRIIMEYLDERFPHPPLHPVDPVARARARMLLHRIDRDWFEVLEEIEAAPPGNVRTTLVQKLRVRLTEAIPLFAARPYFLSDEFSLVDCALAPLLWRLPSLGIDLQGLADSVNFYARRIFERDAFQASLNDHDRILTAPDIPPSLR